MPSSGTARTRVASLDFDDPAWERVATPIYEEGIARNDLPFTIDTLSRAAAATTNQAIKSPILVVLGRAYRRFGDNAAATSSLQAAKSAAPGTPYAKEADGLLYEIRYRSIGLPPPSISRKTRDGRAIDLAALRGRPVVLVFWGTTCVVCMEEVPLLSELHSRYANQAIIIGVSVDTSVERVDRVKKEKAMSWPILADGNGFDGPIPKAYHIQGTPELFVLDGEGRIFARLESAKQLEARLKEALNAP